MEVYSPWELRVEVYSTLGRVEEVYLPLNFHTLMVIIGRINRLNCV